MKRSFLVLTMLATSGVAACAGIFGFDRLEEGASPTEAGSDTAVPIGDAGSDVDARVIVTVPTGCDKLGVPDPPTTGSGNQMPVQWMAFNNFDLGNAFDGGAPQIAALNLDLQCSSSVDTTSCISKATTPEPDQPTPVGGDNAGYHLISIPGPTSPFTPKGIYDALQAGQFGAVLSLDLYNGELDDPSVKVNIFPALGVNKGTPEFTQTDEWFPDKAFDKGGATSAFFAFGYVANGQLVVHLDGAGGSQNGVEFYVPVGGEGSYLTLHLTNVVLTAKVTKDFTDVDGGDAGTPNYILTDGVVAGRWATTDMLAAIGALDDSDGKGVCDPTGTQGYSEIVKGAICEAADLARNASDDVNAQAAADGKKKVACGAVSVGARFGTYHVIKRSDTTKDRAPGVQHTCDAGYAICPTP